MEGNDCYKFSTIRNFLEKQGCRPILNVIEIGVNVGNVTLQIREYFPNARIIGLEPVEEYWRIAASRTAHISNITLLQKAATYRHRYVDNQARHTRNESAPLRICKALPDSGCGWEGGSVVTPASEVEWILAKRPGCYEVQEASVPGITLEEVAEMGQYEVIDLIKSDCEGCELSVFGSASISLLKKTRFIVGEYHCLADFYHTVCERLFPTHKVNLIGDAHLGAFFAELRGGDRDGILLNDNSGMYQLRPWLCDFPIQWHLFNPEYVLEAERHAHAL